MLTYLHTTERAIEMTPKDANTFWLSLTLAAAWLLAAGGAPAQDAQNRQIRSIQLRAYPDRYLIQIRMDQPEDPLVTPPPGPGVPLRVEIARADFAPSLRPGPPSNALIKGFTIRPSSAGLVTMDFELATHRVDATDWIMRDGDEGYVIIKLKPRPGVTLPPDTQLAADHRTSRPHVSIPKIPTTGTATASSTLALPAPHSPAVETTPRLTPAQVLPTGPPALPGRGEIRPPSLQDLETADFFPYHLATGLQFQRAEDFQQAYREKRFADAVEIGTQALEALQPRSSLSALLYLLAECRHQLALQKEKDPDPLTTADWPAALNHWRQARLFTPDSPLRPFADYRLSQVYGRMRDPVRRKAILDRLVKENTLPEMPQVLFEYGEALRDCAAQSFSPDDYLERAAWAFENYVQRYPRSERRGEALMRLGDCRYWLAELAREAGAPADHRMQLAYDAYTEALKTYRFPSVEAQARYALAAHRVGAINLFDPSAKQHLDSVRNTPDAASMLAYGRYAEKAGERLQALQAYNRVVTSSFLNASPRQVRGARLALARLSREDLERGGLTPAIRYKDYTDALETLKELASQSKILEQRHEVQAEQARHHLLRGENVEAIDLIGSLLESQALPPDLGRDLGARIWEVLPGVMGHFHQAGDPMLALRVYRTFGAYLENHPKRDAVLLTCARILAESRLPKEALEALDQIRPDGGLDEGERARAEFLRRELNLDPADTDVYKREAPALLDLRNDDMSRARVLRRLAEIYSGEGHPAYAAQLYLQGAGLEALPWRETAGCFADAARQYEKAMVFSKAFTTCWQGIRALEKSGVSPADASQWMGDFLMGMGENAEKMGDHEQATKAYSQYLSHYPEGLHARSARYLLARTYEQTDRLPEARAEYEELAKAASDDPFWRGIAEASSKQLDWRMDILAPEQGEKLP